MNFSEKNGDGLALVGNPNLRLSLAGWVNRGRSFMKLGGNNEKILTISKNIEDEFHVASFNVYY